MANPTEPVTSEPATKRSRTQDFRPRVGGKLTPQQRAAAVADWLECRNLQAVADRFGISKHTVRGYLVTRGIKKVKHVETPESKQCSRCRQVKPASAFGAQRHVSDGLNHSCLACVAQQRQEARDNPPRKPLTHKVCCGCRVLKPAADFGNKAATPSKLQSRCRDCERKDGREKQQRINNPPAMDGTKVCTKCGTEKPVKAFAAVKINRDGRSSSCRKCYSLAARPRDKRNARKLRLEVIAAYGGRCACCGNNHEQHMALDHIHNDGKEHRKQVGSGIGFYKWIKRNGFPKGQLQLLCHSCNMAKMLYGSCRCQEAVIVPLSSWQLTY